MYLNKMCLLLLGGVSAIIQLGLVSCVVLFMSYFFVDLLFCPLFKVGY